MHSKMFYKIKAWYEAGVWPKSWIHDAVGKKITAAEYEEITGEVYE